MPDPNVTLTAIQSHTTTLQDAISRHAANAGRCKVWGAGIVAGVVLLAAGKAQVGTLPWVAGVVGLLAVADACQVVLARRGTDAYNGFMRKLPLNGGNAMKAEECFVLPGPDVGLREAGRVLGALGSFSVWPFYGALIALLVAFHGWGGGGMENGSGGCCGDGKSARLLPSSATKGCSAGGGCGTSGGCGSGGCGASSGKGCGCGSGAAGAAKAAQSTPIKSAQSTPARTTPSALKPVQPVNGVFPNTRVMAPPANVRPPAANMTAPGVGGTPALPPQPPGTRPPASGLPAQPPPTLPTLPIRTNPAGNPPEPKP